MTEFDFLRAGVRFVRTPTRTPTRDGHTVTLDVIKVHGPPDAELIAALKAQIERRMVMLRDLAAARRACSGALGTCETCSDPLVIQSGDTLKQDMFARGMCVLCQIARWNVVMG